MLDSTVQHPTPVVNLTPERLTLICRKCDGEGCGFCHGDGEFPEPMVRCITCWTMVPESHIADAEAQFCRDCAMAADEPTASYAATAEDARWTAVHAAAYTERDPFIAAQLAMRSTARAPFVDALDMIRAGGAA